MSAFIVSKEHIDALIDFAVWKDMSAWDPQSKTRRLVSDFPDIIGQILVDQNFRSVNERYQEKKDIDSLYKFKEQSAGRTAVQILKACDCYDYQSCETDDYEQTFAASIIDAIRHRAIDLLDGYEEADWEIVDKEKQTAEAA